MRKRDLCCRPVSVRLSARHVGALYPDGWRYRKTFFLGPVAPWFYFFWPRASIPNSKGNPFSGSAKYTGWEKLAVFDGYRRLSPKRYEIGPYSCYGTLIGSHMHSIEWWHFQWPWVTPNPVFKVTAYLKLNISKTVHIMDKVNIEH